MATPEAEETVAAPATTEEVVKSAEGGEKEAPKAPAKEPAKVEETASKVEQEPKEGATAEEPAATANTAATEGEPTEPFKEESNVDLKAPETKALEEFRIRIAKAIEDNEFKVPKKAVEAPKEPEPSKEPEADSAPQAPTTPETTETATKAPPSEGKSEEKPSSTEAPPTKAPAAVDASAAKTEAPPAEKIVEKPKEETKVEVKENAPPAPVTPPTGEKSVTSEPEPSASASGKASPGKSPVETESKAAAVTPEGTAAAPPEEPTPAPVEEEPEDTTPPEDVSFWGVPLLHTKGDERTDIILLKFLRARDLNVTQAFEQLKKAIIWRKTFKADKLLEEEFGKDFDDVSFYYAKDKEGHPVCYNVYSPFQGNKELYSKAFGDSTKLHEFIRWRIMVLEKGIKLLNFSPEGPNAMVQISDVKYFPSFPGTHKNVKSAYKEAVLILQDNYPELVVKQVFVNAPWYFRTFYLFVSRYFSARQKSKVSFYSPARTTEGLLKIIPGEALPVAYGGLSRKDDPDFKGVDAPAKVQVIKGSDKATIEIPVTESEGIILYELAVTGYDVTYNAEYVPSAEGRYLSIIKKPFKLEASRQEPFREEPFKFEEPGKIVIVLENSTKKKKTVIYRYVVKSSTAPTAESKSQAELESQAEPEQIAG